VIAGVSVEPSSFVSLTALMKEVTIGFAVYYIPAEFRTVVAAFVDGLVAPALLLVRRVPLAGVNEAYDGLVRASAGAKILVEP
jgi:threonine dehydrogenase-like Zn-dependent dehydrogenase